MIFVLDKSSFLILVSVQLSVKRFLLFLRFNLDIFVLSQYKIFKRAFFFTFNLVNAVFSQRSRLKFLFLVTFNCCKSGLSLQRRFTRLSQPLVLISVRFSLFWQLIFVSFLWFLTSSEDRFVQPFISANLHYRPVALLEYINLPDRYSF